MRDEDDFVPADVLLLGTFHMNNPGRDLINLVADDVLAEHRQDQLQELASRLAGFAPTKVCVERAPTDQGELDRKFSRFLRDEADPSRSEIVQVGFRLARLCGLDRVHAIDDDTPMEWDALDAFFAAHADEDARFREDIARAQEEERHTSEELARTPLRDFLREMNGVDALRRSASWYVDSAGLGGVGEHAGADMLASWYRRNIRIFSNLSGITESGDRIFAVFGSGHIPILRGLIDLSARHRLIEAHDFL